MGSMEEMLYGGNALGTDRAKSRFCAITIGILGALALLY